MIVPHKVQVILSWLAVRLINGRLLIPRLHALLLGLTVLVAILFSLHSIACHLFGPGTVWKGRAYSSASGSNTQNPDCKSIDICLRVCYIGYEKLII